MRWYSYLQCKLYHEKQNCFILFSIHVCGLFYTTHTQKRKKYTCSTFSIRNIYSTKNVQRSIIVLYLSNICSHNYKDTALVTLHRTTVPLQHTKKEEENWGFSPECHWLMKIWSWNNSPHSMHSTVKSNPQFSVFLNLYGQILDRTKIGHWLFSEHWLGKANIINLRQLNSILLSSGSKFCSTGVK